MRTRLHRRAAAAAVATAAAVTAATLAAPGAAGAAEAEALGVDFSQTTGKFRGGASGTLYGFGDDGSPTQAVINGAHLTNSTQKPPGGAQHPSGDVLRIEDGFFAKHGKEMGVYLQDFYPDWPYLGGARPEDTRTYDQSDGSFTEGGNGTWDYLEVVRHVVTRIATESDHPGKYLLVPFNEPDLMWYQDWAAMKDRFMADWTEVYQLIHEIYDEELGGEVTPRIGGMSHASWHGDGRDGDILKYTAANDVRPDVYIWHELGGANPDGFRQHVREFRELEDEHYGTGSELPITINEWGVTQDMSVPGSIVRWFAAFEEEKADGQTAYWNYAGNFSDNMARANGANGGWWLFKLYGDLAGSDTVEVTPPNPDNPHSLRGIGAVDEKNKKATLLYGGTDADVTVDATGLNPSVFGTSVDVEVREIALTGAEGIQGNPRVVQAADGVQLAEDGSLPDLTVPTYDKDAAYQVVITPDQQRDVEKSAAAQPWTTAVEAEDTQLTDAPVRGTGDQAFQASGDKDVGPLDQAGARSDFTVDVPGDGTYRLQVIGSAPAPGRHALFVDGEFSTTVQYAADLSSRDKWNYRGSAEAEVDLPAGEHTLSLRASRDGTTALPGSDITLDKYVLTEVTGGGPTAYPASTMRLQGGARLTFDDPATAGSARIAGDGQRAETYATAWESGYHDVAVDFTSSAATSADLHVNGVKAGSFEATEAGAWRATAQVHLSEGINELEISSGSGIDLTAVTTTRNKKADDAAVTVEAEDAVHHGTAAVATPPAESGTNASGGSFVTKLGDDTENSANTIEIERQAGFDKPGAYTAVVRYSNPELRGSHPYNPQVVDRGLQISEAGEEGHAGSGMFRNNHHAESFWERSISVSLTTAEGALTLGNDEPGASAPDIDSVTFAPVTSGPFRTAPQGS